MKNSLYISTNKRMKKQFKKARDDYSTRKTKSLKKNPETDCSGIILWVKVLVSWNKMSSRCCYSLHSLFVKVEKG